MPDADYQAITESQAMQRWPVDSQELVRKSVFGLTLNCSISKMEDVVSQCLASSNISFVYKGFLKHCLSTLAEGHTCIYCNNSVCGSNLQAAMPVLT